ncbi:MAG: phosphotransferase [Deltaproteobacteria bacterium]|nr:phosphotransferase [Deltaproteobacteria bacterium]
MDHHFRRKLAAFMKEACPGGEDFSIDPLAGDGSQRVFWRISAPESGQSFISMANPPETEARKRENNAYVMIALHLQQKGVPLPNIHYYDLARGWFIMEDLGSLSLQDVVLSIEDPVPVYKKVLKHLFRLQTLGCEGFDTAWCAQTERYDRTVMQTYEAHYFRDAFLKGFVGYEGSLAHLEAAFDHLAERASRADGQFFMHRDFQSRNLMVSGDRIGIIDWQGGRLGPLGYDLASILLDPYVRLSHSQKQEIYDVYLMLVKEHNPAWVAPFKRNYPYLAIQRNLQILGAFSFLSKVMKKTYFEAYIPHALKTLKELIDSSGDQGLEPLGQLVSTIALSGSSLNENERKTK